MNDAGTYSTDSTADFGAHVARAQREGRLVVQPRMGMSEPVVMRSGLLAVRGAAERDGLRAAGTVTIDSFTRVGQHAEVRTALAVGQQLNGYPIVDHPPSVTAAVLHGVESPGFPVQVRHGSPRPQRIVAALTASGLHATEGGPVSYCLPYSRVPVEDAVRAWAESARMLAGLRDAGRRPHLETFGGCMMGQLCPPALLVAISVLEGVFFHRHGIDCLSLSYAQQTHPGQDAEALAALRSLGTEFIPGARRHLVLYTYMGVFPRTTGGATMLLEEAARLSVRCGVGRLIVKTVAEAHRIPTVAENLAALRAADEAATAERRRIEVAPPPPPADTGIAAQARAIIEAVLDRHPDPGAALAGAVHAGLLDVPYCLHPDNPGRTRATVDASGRLQWTALGALPLRGLAEVAPGAPARSSRADHLLNSLTYVERSFDGEALERAVREPLPL